MKMYKVITKDDKYMIYYSDTKIEDLIDQHRDGVFLHVKGENIMYENISPNEAHIKTISIQMNNIKIFIELETEEEEEE